MSAIRRDGNRESWELPPISPLCPSMAADGNAVDVDVDSGGSDDDDDDDDDEAAEAAWIVSTDKTAVVFPPINPKLRRGKERVKMARIESMSSGPTERSSLTPRQRAHSCPPPASILQNDKTPKSPIPDLAPFPTFERHAEAWYKAGLDWGALPKSFLQVGSPGYPLVPQLSGGKKRRCKDCFHSNAVLALPLHMNENPFPTFERDAEARYRAGLEGEALPSLFLAATPTYPLLPFPTLEPDVEVVWRDMEASLEWTVISASFLQEGETLESPVLDSVPVSTIGRDEEAMRKDVENSIEK
ncbi:MAG: hypothetical protein M1840_006673 [Geoglossum simile]|nr:MAG: hypothetical protein M1840_006673 [Geoglossum simile]